MRPMANLKCVGYLGLFKDLAWIFSYLILRSNINILVKIHMKK